MHSIVQSLAKLRVTWRSGFVSRLDRWAGGGHGGVLVCESLLGFLVLGAYVTAFLVSAPLAVLLFAICGLPILLLAALALSLCNQHGQNVGIVAAHAALLVWVVAVVLTLSPAAEGPTLTWADSPASWVLCGAFGLFSGAAIAVSMRARLRHRSRLTSDQERLQARELADLEAERERIGRESLRRVHAWDEALPALLSWSNDIAFDDPHLEHAARSSVVSELNALRRAIQATRENSELAEQIGAFQQARRRIEEIAALEGWVRAPTHAAQMDPRRAPPGMERIEAAAGEAIERILEGRGASAGAAGTSNAGLLPAPPAWLEREAEVRAAGAA